MRHSPYNIIHALALTALLLTAILSNGLESFWRQFLYGLNQPMTPQTLKQMLGVSTAMFGGLLLVFWVSTLFSKSASASKEDLAPPRTPQNAGTPFYRLVQALRAHRSAIRLVLLSTPVLTIVALALNWLGSHAIEWCTGIAPADQELVKCFADGTYSVPLRAVLVLFVLFQAPLLEEPLFRGILFRGFFRSMPFLPAALLSGAIFALVHVNAASFVALWFLGIAFAWLYHRTGSILAPMTCHFLFNAVNLILVLYFPELATT